RRRRAPALRPVPRFALPTGHPHRLRRHPDRPHRRRPRPPAHLLLSARPTPAIGRRGTNRYKRIVDNWHFFRIDPEFMVPALVAGAEAVRRRDGADAAAWRQRMFAAGRIVFAIAVTGFGAVSVIFVDFIHNLQ